jgi:hypothetical protein
MSDTHPPKMKSYIRYHWDIQRQINELEMARHEGRAPNFEFNMLRGRGSQRNPFAKSVTFEKDS